MIWAVEAVAGFWVTYMGAQYWPIYAIAATILAAASAPIERQVLAVFVVGLLAVYAAKLALTERAFWLFSSGVWVFIGWHVATLAGGFHAHSGLILVVAGLLVIPARVWGDYEAGNPFLVLSDLCSVPFLFLAGRGGAVYIASRIGRLAAGNRGGVLRFAADRGANPATEIGARRDRG